MAVCRPCGERFRELDDLRGHLEGGCPSFRGPASGVAGLDRDAAMAFLRATSPENLPTWLAVGADWTPLRVIHAAVGGTQPALSHRMRVLQKAGGVERRKVGRGVQYRACALRLDAQVVRRIVAVERHDNRPEEPEAVL